MENTKKILIVEDEAPLLYALRDGITRAGFGVLLAKNGEEGLSVALANQPDLILLDVVMPVMDGITMLKKLRQNERGKDIEVIILSNLSDSQMVADAIALGSHDYLVKSDWKMGDLVKTIGDKLNREKISNTTKSEV